MACPKEKNIKEKHRDKLSIKNSHLRYEKEDNVIEWKSYQLLLDALEEGRKQVQEQVKKIIQDENTMKKTCNEMLKTVFIESEMILKKKMSGIIQAEWLS